MALRSEPEHEPEPVVREGEGPTDKGGWLQHIGVAERLLREALAEIARIKVQLDIQHRTAGLTEGELKSAIKVKDGEIAKLRAQLKTSVDSRQFCPSCQDKDLYDSVARDLKVRGEEIARLKQRLRDSSETPDGYALLSVEQLAEMQRGVVVNAYPRAVSRERAVSSEQRRVAGVEQ